MFLQIMFGKISSNRLISTTETSLSSITPGLQIHQHLQIYKQVLQIHQQVLQIHQQVLQIHSEMIQGSGNILALDLKKCEFLRWKQDPSVRKVS